VIEVVADALRPYLVRIHSLNGPSLGTGFFATPNRVITCSHVIGADNTFLVFPASNLIGEGLEAVVRARSQLGVVGEFPWPFPDLAVLEVSADAHPCAPVVAINPTGQHDCFTYGFAPREDETPIGTSRKFRFIGSEGDGYFIFGEGQATRGLSGAPVVCPTRRAVVGVITASRDVGTDLGAWASPIASLLIDSDIDSDLKDQGRIIASENPVSAIRSRTLWWKVLPHDRDTDCLLRGWADFNRQPKSKPSDLLLADFGVVPHLFHDLDLQEAVDWCESPQAISIRNVPAQAGAGKTRFALELCKEMYSRDWVVGFWQGSVQVSEVHAPRLIVIDYAENVNVMDLRALFTSLTTRSTPMAPARIMLLTRARGPRSVDPLEQLRSHCPASLRTVLDAADDCSVTQSPLTDEQRKTLYATAVDRFSTAWLHENATQLEIPDLSHFRYGTALEVLFEAFDCVLATELAPDEREAESKIEPIERVLDHEERYWGTAPVTGASRSQIRLAVALITMVGADNKAEAESLMNVVYGSADARAEIRRATIGWLYNIYGDSHRLIPLRPDRVGEALIARAISENADNTHAIFREMFNALSPTQLDHTLVVLNRVCTSHRAIRPIVATAIAANLKNIATTIDSILKEANAEQLAESIPATLLGDFSIITSLARLVTGHLQYDLVAACLEDEQYARNLAAYYSVLGELVGEVGQVPEAQRLFSNARLVVNDLVDLTESDRKDGYRLLSSQLEQRRRDLENLDGGAPEEGP